MSIDRVVVSCTDPSAPELVYEAGLAELKAFLKENSPSATAESLFAALSTRLHLPDAQIRLAAFRIVDHFFTKSKHFRRVCLSKLSVLLDCGLGNAQQPLAPPPEPREAAEELKHFVLHCIAKWKVAFSHLYPEILMGCQYIKGQLGLTLPNGTGPYVPLREIEERRNRQKAYRRALIGKQELFVECRRARNEISHVLDLVDQSPVEWADLPVPYEDDGMAPTETQVNGGGGDSNSALDGTGCHVNGEATVKVVEWMDPVLEGSLSEHLLLIQKKYHPKLQRLITAATKVFVDDLRGPEAVERNRTMSEAVRLRNELLDQRNKIAQIGVTPAGKRRRNPRTATIANSHHSGGSKRARFEAPDPTRAKSDTAFIMSSHEVETWESYTVKRKQYHASLSNSVGRELKKVPRLTRTPDNVLQALASRAPNLSREEVKEVLQSDNWKGTHSCTKLPDD